jgi:hypothetical protein
MHSNDVRQFISLPRSCKILLCIQLLTAIHDKAAETF